MGPQEELHWIVHDEIQCKGCGMLPIIGPRYDSESASYCANCKHKCHDKLKVYYKKLKWLVSLHVDTCSSGSIIQLAEKWANEYKIIKKNGEFEDKSGTIWGKRYDVKYFKEDDIKL